MKELICIEGTYKAGEADLSAGKSLWRPLLDGLPCILSAGGSALLDLSRIDCVLLKVFWDAAVPFAFLDFLLQRASNLSLVLLLMRSPFNDL